MRVKYPSLELNWLKYPKDVSIPDIIIVGEDDYEYGGCYYEPEKGELFVCDHPYPLDRGIMLIREDNYESTLCHEFRHHLQLAHFGWEWDAVDFNFDLPYEDAIVDYFTKSVYELDALLYEIKYYPNDVNLMWMEWLIETLENQNKA